jgi:hypothetical protein
MLIGKWEKRGDGGLFFDSHTYLRRYEFTHSGGFMVEINYDPIEKIFLEPDTSNYFRNWSYSEIEETIYFENYRGSRWTKHAYGVTQDSIILGCKDCPYYRIKE